LQVARQLPPVTLVATVTFVPVLSVALSLAVVEALVRRLTLHAASLATLAYAVAGRDTARIADANKADRITVARIVNWCDVDGRRAAWRNTGTSLG
jgi:hypothetical protein